MKELTYKQKRFGLNIAKYYVCKDRWEPGWLVYLPTSRLIFPDEKMVHRFISQEGCILFINIREKRVNEAKARRAQESSGIF